MDTWYNWYSSLPPKFDITIALQILDFDTISSDDVHDRHDRKTDTGVVLHLQDADCRMRPRTLAKVNRDLCNNVVAARHCWSAVFCWLANNGGTRVVPNVRVTGRPCFSSIVINTCRAEARWNFFPRSSVHYFINIQSWIFWERSHNV